MQSKAKTSIKYKNILKGRLFEFTIKHLFEKAGFIQDIYMDQLTKTGKKRLHGRGATYDPDYYGVLKIGLPFMYPILVIVEAKFFANNVNIKIAREFLGATIDIMQYARINTKMSGAKRYEAMIMPRFQYCPVIISRKGFDSNAKGLLYAHGIKFIGYDNNGIFSQVTELLDNFLTKVNFSKITPSTLKSITSFEVLQELEGGQKKAGFHESFINLKSFIHSIDSYIAIIGYQHTVNIVIYPSFKNNKKRYEIDFKIRYAGKGIFYITRGSTTTMRSKIGEFYLPISKPEMKKLEKVDGLLKETFSNISVVKHNGIQNIQIKDIYYNELKQDFDTQFEQESEEIETDEE